MMINWSKFVTLSKFLYISRNNYSNKQKRRNYLVCYHRQTQNSLKALQRGAVLFVEILISILFTYFIIPQFVYAKFSESHSRCGLHNNGAGISFKAPSHPRPSQSRALIWTHIHGRRPFASAKHKHRTAFTFKVRPD